MKIDRAVCAHKFSMLRRYKHSDKYVLTGCVETPSPDNPFCPKHKETESPVILAGNVTSQTRKKLKQFCAKTTSAFERGKCWKILCFVRSLFLNKKETNF